MSRSSNEEIYIVTDFISKIVAQTALILMAILALIFYHHPKQSLIVLAFLGVIFGAVWMVLNVF